MSEELTLSHKIARAVLLGILLILMLLIFLLALTTTWPAEFGFRLLVGFIYFLEDKFSSMTSNPDIWIPGITAFLLSLGIIHCLGRHGAKHRNARWKISNTLCIGLALPTLFIISFIIPGIFLQLKLLSQTQMTQRRINAGANITANLRNCAQALAGHTNMHGLEQFPEVADPIISEYMTIGSIYDSYIDSNHLPREPFIYLGTGHGPDSDPSLPLIISSPYKARDGSKMRVLCTIGYEIIHIPDRAVDEWIQRNLEARNAAGTSVDQVH